LKKLLASKHDGIRARALVGLCKVASAGGEDTSRRTMAEGSTIKLAEQCKRLIVNAELAIESRRFAVEGLSYLTLDADVKQLIVEDVTLIRAMVEVAKRTGAVSVYSMASIFVNLTNSFPKPEHIAKDEMKKLAEFSKHHVPEEHEKDSEKYVRQRVAILVREGATSACVAVSKTDSTKCMDLLARCLGAFTLDKAHRGQVVAEGGAKLLLRLALDAIEETRPHAAQALARVGITISPELAFPGQRMYEVVRPLLDLLHPDRTALQNYEALLTLTNLAGHSDSVRKRILKEKCIPKIEEYWYMQEHPELRAAACELLLNLIHSEEGRKTQLEEGTDRLKLWFLYAASDEDKDDDKDKSGRRLVRAAAGGLAMLTDEKRACVRITEIVAKWTDCLKDIARRGDPEAHYRGMLAIENMMRNDYDVCAKMCQTELLEMVIAISKFDDPKRARSRDAAQRCLQIAEQHQFIVPTAREQYERRTHTSTVNKDAIIVSSIKEESSDDEET